MIITMFFQGDKVLDIHLKVLAKTPQDSISFAIVQGFLYKVVYYYQHLIQKKLY